MLRMLFLGAYTENTWQCLNVHPSFLLLAVSGTAACFLGCELHVLTTFHYAFTMVEVIGLFHMPNRELPRTRWGFKKPIWTSKNRPRFKSKCKGHWKKKIPIESFKLFKRRVFIVITVNAISCTIILNFLGWWGASKHQGSLTKFSRRRPSIFSEGVLLVIAVPN